MSDIKVGKYVKEFIKNRQDIYEICTIKKRWYFFNSKSEYGYLELKKTKKGYEITRTSDRNTHYKLSNLKCFFVNFDEDFRVSLVGKYVLSFWESKGKERDSLLKTLNNLCEIYIKENEVINE